MKKVVAGIITGALLASGTTVFAKQVKQYILTDAPYSIYFNEWEYKDKANPILNYEGSTYIPLAKMADLAGVKYSWNDKAKRVEISAKANDSVQKGLVKENGNTVLYAYDKEGNYKGKFTDKDDLFSKNGRSVIQYSSENLPSISNGWLPESLLNQIYGNKSVAERLIFGQGYPENWLSDINDSTVNGIRLKKREWGESHIMAREVSESYDTHIIMDDSVSPMGRDYIVQSPFRSTPKGKVRDILFKFKIPAEWAGKEDCPETNVQGLRMKSSDFTHYYNVEDLRRLGIIPAPTKYNFAAYYNISDLQKAGILK